MSEQKDTSVQSLIHNFDEALRLMEAALTDCPEDLWQTDLWPDEAPTRPGPRMEGCTGRLPGSSGTTHCSASTTTSPPSSSRGVRRNPFDDNTYGYPNRVFTKPELLGYVDRCRSRVGQTLDALTEEMAARPVPTAHRKHGMLFGVLLGSLPLHVVEHASQVRQFLAAAGVKVQPMPGDHGYTG